MNGREKSHMDTDSLPKAVAAKIIDVGPSGTDSLPKVGAAKIINAGPSGIDSLPKAGAAKIIDAELSREVLVKKEYGSFLFESYMPMEDFIENDAAGFENKKKIAEEIALDLMAKHAEFYSEMKQEELVKRKSVLMCGKGSRLLQIDMCLDHGVESGNEALMSCSDCKPENIQGFGTCINPIPVKSPEWTHYPFLNSDGKYQCMPVLGKRWIQNNSQIYLETRDEGTVEALKSGAYLTCIYGGVITVVEVEEIEELITMEQMRKFNFSITEEGLIELNKFLWEYDLTDRGSIALFMATCGHESEKGTCLLEKGGEDYYKEHGYDSNTCGAGYMQVTKTDQDKFYEYIGKEPPENKAQDIALNYPWEASIWEWMICEKGQGVIVGGYVEKYGTSENIFIITQYFINSYLSNEEYPYFDSDLRSIRVSDEVNYSYNLEDIWTDKKGIEHKGVLYINGRSYRLPKEYESRLNNYKEAVECFL